MTQCNPGPGPEPALIPRETASKPRRLGVAVRGPTWGPPADEAAGSRGLSGITGEGNHM